jgi:drug/metabolite transporter (DMT)-like permease
MFILFYPEMASFASVVVSRWGWILLRALVRNERYTPLEVNGMSMVGSGILALITATMLNQWKDVPFHLSQHFYALCIHSYYWQCNGYMLYAYVIKHVNLTFVSLAGFSNPILLV